MKIENKKIKNTTCLKITLCLKIEWLNLHTNYSKNKDLL